MDRGVWENRVAKSQAQLKRLSVHTSDIGGAVDSLSESALQARGDRG